jgi:hypothetical protein
MAKQPKTPEEKAQRAQYMREYRKNNPEKVLASERKSKKKARAAGYVWEGQLESCKKWYHANKAWAMEYQKARNLEITKQTFVAYGGSCECCGESRLMLLTIDHVRNNGTEHRREVLGPGRRAGIHFYRWLMKQGFPQTGEFRLLCYNCNLGRERNGGVCPHKDIDAIFCSTQKDIQTKCTANERP